MDLIGDGVAACVLRTFDALPRKSKPRTYPDNSQEWVPLSGIVLCTDKPELPCTALEKERWDQTLHCVSLGTGMRCLPVQKVPLANGRCLHDWHAEIVAIRAFNLFLLQECAMLCDSSVTSSFLRRVAIEDRSSSEPQPFAIKDNIRIYMYCSEIPCGDASMELTMSAQEDPTPWDSTSSAKEKEPSLKGRGYFSELGVVRRKPSRADAQETLSKSCSDKISMKQCTSLLSSVTSTLVQPCRAYLDGLVLPADQHVNAATKRAFSATGRMKTLVTSHGTLCEWGGGHRFHPFQVFTTAEEFPYSRRAGHAGTKKTGSNITAIWTPNCQEVLIGGSIQGFKQFSERGSSAISKVALWKTAIAVARKCCIAEALECLVQSTYQGMKKAPLLDQRQRVKDQVRTQALQGWVRNDSGDGFSLEG